MAKPPELWAFILANTGLFAITSVLAGLTYLAYRQSDARTSYLTATVGFGFVALGGLVEPVYQLGIQSDYALSGTELLWLQAGEGTLIAIGLGLVFYAITHHESGPSSDETDRRSVAAEEVSEFDFR